MNKNINIRLLTKNDLASFFDLRLEALQDSPSAFLSSYEDEKAAGLPYFENFLFGKKGEHFVFGAFVNDELAGTLAISPEKRLKLQHKCIFWAIYVKPNHRGCGIAKKLMSSAIAHAKDKMGCLMITLTVTTNNSSAKKLYDSYGFKTWGTEPKSVRIDGNFYDEFYMSLSL